MIEVHRMDNTIFEVIVDEEINTTHEVILNRNYYMEMTNGAVTEEVLIYKSFEFLLAREPNSMILKRFNLSVIEKYYPEYRREIGKKI